MAYDLARLESALVNADKAGDVEAAKTLAAEIRKMRAQTSQTEVPTAAPPPEKGYIENRIDAVKQLATPDFWKGIGNELTNFPTPTPENRQQVQQSAEEAALAVLPTTQLSKAARAVIAPSQKAVEPARQALLNTAGVAGYSIPRSNIKQTLLTNLGERFGGKQAVEATAQGRNQPVTNKLAAKALGLADDAPITPEVLKGIRDEAGKAYEAVKQVGTLTADNAYAKGLRSIMDEFSGASKDFPELASQEVRKLVQGLAKKEVSSEGAVEMIKAMREQARANLGHSSNAGDKLLGKAQRKAAEVLEDLIERNIEPRLGKETLDNYRAARTLIAKTYSVEKALNPSTGNVVGTELAKQASKGVPLSAELKQAADFARGFPRLAREPMGAPPSGGLFEPLVYGTTGGLMTGGPGALAALIPLLGKPMARRAMVMVPKVPVASQPQSELVQMLMEAVERGAIANTSNRDKMALAHMMAR